jgi:hypothetical protein
LIEFALALSLHLGLEGDYNEIHPHIRYNEQNYIAGVYYNSESRISFYAGKRWEYKDFGLEAGAVTGYSHGDVIPYGRATYKNFYVAPALEGDDTVGAVIGYELKL